MATMPSTDTAKKEKKQPTTMMAQGGRREHTGHWGTDSGSMSKPTKFDWRKERDEVDMR